MTLTQLAASVVAAVAFLLAAFGTYVPCGIDTEYGVLPWNTAGQVACYYMTHTPYAIGAYAAIAMLAIAATIWIAVDR